MEVTGARFLVTGGASLIGSHVVEELLSAGAAEVRVLDNLSGGVTPALERLLGHDRVSLHRGDVLRTADVLQAVRGVDGVFHGAALITAPMADHPETGVDVNVRGTAVVLAGASHAGARKVVLMSSVSVYGNTSGPDIAETAPFVTEGLGWPSQLYGGSKLMSEALCRAYAERHGLQWVALRAPSVYGPFQHERGLSSANLARIWASLRRDTQPTVSVDPEEAHDYVFVSDVASAVLAAFRSDATGVSLNVSSGRSTTYREVVALLQDLAGSGPVRFRAPVSAVQLTSSGELSYDWSAAQHCLGWAPRTSLREGLGTLTNWLDEQS